MSDLDGLDRPKSAYFVRKTTPQSSSTPSSSSSQPTKTGPVLNINGTRTSLQNNQLLTPIGIPSIDYFIGTFSHFY